MNEGTRDAHNIEPPITHVEELDFKSLAGRLNDDLTFAATRLMDSVHGFASLIQAFVSAGEALERSISIHRELGAASQRAVEDAREAARAALASAGESQSARDASKAVLDLTTEQYGTIADLVEDLRQRIAALAMLAAPMPRVAPKKTTPAVTEEVTEATTEVTEVITEPSDEAAEPSGEYQSYEGSDSAEPPPDEEWKTRLAAEVDDLPAKGF